MNAELVRDAADASGFPDDGLPEVAIMGRSNVGKSSFINALVSRKKLARTSGRPGKTRRIHFYGLEKRCYLVDLPGYGYAAVGKEERASWRPLVESYLLGTRTALRGAVLLVDARRGPEDEELELLDWLRAQRIDARLVGTKADKLKAREVAPAEGALSEATGMAAEHIALLSSTTGRGMGRAAAWISEWTSLELTRADGSAFR